MALPKVNLPKIPREYTEEQWGKIAQLRPEEVIAARSGPARNLPEVNLPNITDAIAPRETAPEPTAPELPAINLPKIPAEYTLSKEARSPGSESAPEIETGKIESAIPGTMGTAKKMMGAYNTMQSAAFAQGQAARSMADAESQYYGKLQENAEEMERKRIEKENIRQTELADQEKQYKKDIEDFQKSSVDSGRLFKNASTGQKVLAGIGLFLGAFGQGGQNESVKIIQDAINRDIDEQKANINIKGAAAEKSRGVFKDMLEKHGDERKAEELTRAAMLGNAQLKLAQIESKYKGTESAAKATMLMSQIEIQKQQAYANALKATALSTGFADNVNIKAAISTLPEKEKEAAVKELAVVKDMQNNEKMVDQAFEEIGKSSFYQIGKKAAIKTKLALQLRQLLGVRMSPQAMEKIDDLIPSKTDIDPSTREEKKRQIKNIMREAVKKDTPTLDYYNINPLSRQITEEEISKGFAKK